MRRQVKIFCLIFPLLAGWTADSFVKYEETIPSQILKKYNLEVVLGKRPKFAIVRNTDIQDLKEHPVQGGDLVLLKLRPLELSSAQREIVTNWVKRGAKVYLDGWENARDILPLIFKVSTTWIYLKSSSARVFLFRDHPVNTGVKEIETSPEKKAHHVYWYGGISNLPGDSSVIASLDAGHTTVIVGAFKYGKGCVYFNVLQDPFGRDIDRFQLNLRQWLIGEEVPCSSVEQLLNSANDAEVSKTSN